jgi:hypothetical protein
MKPGVKRFLLRLQTQTESFQADLRQTSNNRSERDLEYIQIRRRIHPLIRNMDDYRYAAWAPHREGIAQGWAPRPVPGPPKPSLAPIPIAVPAPVRGVSFQQEKCSPFRIQAEKVARGRAYPSPFNPMHLAIKFDSINQKRITN